MTEYDISTVFPGWEIVKPIGRGSYGTVYEISRNVLGHRESAALKVVSIPQNDSDIQELLSEGYDRDSISRRYEGFLQSIVREYTMMAEMKGCANIVYCDDVNYRPHEDGIGWDVFIRMELLTPLLSLPVGAFTEPQVICVGTDIARALAFCEKRSVLHRDVKPQNIFVAPDGTFKLGDFGIAKTADRTVGGTRVGTYKFMAPEVFNSLPYGTKADIYSLGLVLYWLLNERRAPFLPLPPQLPTAEDEDFARARRMSGEPLPAPARGSEQLRRVVLRACAYDPKDRYRSAEELLRTLEALEKDAAYVPDDDLTTDGREAQPPYFEPDLTSAGEGTEWLFGDQPVSYGNAPLTGEETVRSDPVPTPPEEPPTPPKRKALVTVGIAALAVLAVVAVLILLMQRGAAPGSTVTNAPTAAAESLYWSLDEDGVLTIGGKGDMSALLSEDKNVPWDPGSVKAVVIKKGVTSVCENAFYGCRNLLTVELPTGLTSIEAYAFANTGLTTIALPKGVTTIGDYAFCKCNGITSIKLPKGVTTIGEYAFFGCKSLTSVTLPKGVTTIGNYAFYGCDSLIIIEFSGSMAQWNRINGLDSITALPVEVRVGVL